MTVRKVSIAWSRPDRSDSSRIEQVEGNAMRAGSVSDRMGSMRAPEKRSTEGTRF